MIRSEFLEVKNKLKHLEKHVTEEECLKKGYEFYCNNCIEIEEILSFEKEKNVSLPNDYKEFLLNIGNGGPFGLYPLNEIRKRPWLSVDKTFPYESAWNPSIPSVDNYDEWNTFDYHYLDNKHIFGTLELTNLGSCLNTHHLLIITGKEHGNVWVDGRSAYCGLLPEKSITGLERVTFSVWFIELLEQELLGCSISYYGI